MRLLPLLLAVTVSASAFAATPAEKPQLHDYSMKFVEYWDANKDKPGPEQVAAFKQQVAPVFPGFYNPERLKAYVTPAQYDGRIETAVKEFASIRAEYIKKARQFGTELPRYTATFKSAFPDFQPLDDIYVLHSLGEMDGGPRTIDGKTVMVFGIDGMVKYHGTGRESAFFHHELFHIHHRNNMGDCGEDAGIWANLWSEGLAVYVAHTLNPDANDVELLLDIPDHMAEKTRAVLPAAFAQLEGVLDNTDEKTYGGLFYGNGDSGGLPKRRGYYLGYLVAKEAGKTHSIQDLARLQCSQVKALVHATVGKLRAEAH